MRSKGLYGYDYYIDKEWRADWVNVETVTTEWESTYAEVETSETYEWSETEQSVDVYTSEEYEVSEEVSEQEIETEESWAETESFEMSEAEEEEVATEEDSDAAHLPGVRGVSFSCLRAGDCRSVNCSYFWDATSGTGSLLSGGTHGIQRKRRHAVNQAPFGKPNRCIANSE